MDSTMHRLFAALLTTTGVVFFGLFVFCVGVGPHSPFWIVVPGLWPFMLPIQFLRLVLASA